MDAVAEPQFGAGVFRQLLHIVGPDSPQITFKGIPLWFADCGAACVLVPGTFVDPRWCQNCLALRGPSATLEQLVHRVSGDDAPEARVIVLHRDGRIVEG